MKKPDKKLKRDEILDKNFRLNPEDRMCPNFDSVSINLEKVAERGEMGIRVLDNFTEEHIM